MRTASFFVLPLLAACSDTTPGTTEPPGSTGSTGVVQGSSETTVATPAEGSDGSTSDGSAESSGEAEPLEPIALDQAWVDTVQGPWLGPVHGTPMGDLPQFFLDFVWNDDALVAVTDNGMGFRIELSFAQTDGQWTLTETGTLPGNFTQSYELHPVAREGDRVTFEVLDRPGYLRVDVEPTASAFEMVVLLRGEGHGTFELARPS